MASVIVCCKTNAGFVMEVDGVSKTIHGYNSQDNLLRVVNGYEVGVTYDVDEGLFDKWVSIHKDHPLVSGGFVWKDKSEKEIKAKAKDLKEVKTGMEQKTKAELDKVAGAKENKDTE